MKKTVKYTKQMYEYLAWRLFREMYGAMEWAEAESKQIDKLVKEAKNRLTEDEIKIVENRVRRMNNDYEEWALESLKKRYWREFDDDDDNDDDDFDFIFPEVDYNEEFYEIWKSAVAKQQTVKIKYDSTTSGMSERLVDPYKSSAPYGEGYCHKRKEVRKFRFDRVINIEMTNKKFKKPKDWKIKNNFSDFKDLENIVKY